MTCPCRFCVKVALEVASRKAREREQERYNREPRGDDDEL